jgi:hypothetical protein
LPNSGRRPFGGCIPPHLGLEFHGGLLKFLLGLLALLQVLRVSLMGRSNSAVQLPPEGIYVRVQAPFVPGGLPWGNNLDTISRLVARSVIDRNLYTVRGLSPLGNALCGHPRIARRLLGRVGTFG